MNTLHKIEVIYVDNNIDNIDNIDNIEKINGSEVNEIDINKELITKCEDAINQLDKLKNVIDTKKKKLINMLDEFNKEKEKEKEKDKKLKKNNNKKDIKTRKSKKKGGYIYNIKDKYGGVSNNRNSRRNHRIERRISRIFTPPREERRVSRIFTPSSTPSSTPSRESLSTVERDISNPILSATPPLTPLSLTSSSSINLTPLSSRIRTPSSINLTPLSSRIRTPSSNYEQKYIFDKVYIIDSPIKSEKDGSDIIMGLGEDDKTNIYEFIHDTFADKEIPVLLKIDTRIYLFSLSNMTKILSNSVVYPCYQANNLKNITSDLKNGKKKGEHNINMDLKLFSFQNLTNRRIVVLYNELCKLLSNTEKLPISIVATETNIKLPSIAKLPFEIGVGKLHCNDGAVELETIWRVNKIECKFSKKEEELLNRYFPDLFGEINNNNNNKIKKMLESIEIHHKNELSKSVNTPSDMNMTPASYDSGELYNNSPLSYDSRELENYLENDDSVRILEDNDVNDSSVVRTIDFSNY